MNTGSVEFIDFKVSIATNIISDPVGQTSSSDFAKMLEEKIQEASISTEEETKAEEKKDKSKAKKLEKKNGIKLGNDILKEANNLKDVNSSNKTYSLLEKIKDKKGISEEQSQSETTKNLNQNVNVVGHALADRQGEGSGQKMSKSKMLSLWAKLAPTVTENVMKKTVRIDIPLVKDIKSIVIKLNSDNSVTASVLASEGMTELIKQNKDKLAKSLKSHNIALKEFKAYKSEKIFDRESGSRKEKRRNNAPAQNATFGELF